MSREHHGGLQIALIVFVILTIALGVTTFMFYKNWDESDRKAATAAESESKAKAAAVALQDDCNALKRIIGEPQTETVNKIRDDFNKDILTYASAYDEAQRFYRQLTQSLYNDLKKKNDGLSAEQTTVRDLKEKLETLEKVKQGQIDTALAEATKAKQDLEEERKKFKEARDAITQERDELAAKVQKAVKTAQTEIDQKEKEKEVAIKVAGTLRVQLKDEKEKGEKLQKTDFEKADGTITQVSQRTGTVWINLGSGDALPRQMGFAVYSPDTTNVINAKAKAKIEVTDVLEPHLAAGRIVEDDPGNPILRGDLIHTPLWHPGEQVHFALVGEMDVNDDGHNEQKMVYDLITMAGGIIDAGVDEKGKRFGKLTTSTRYLVLGKAPDEKSKSKERKVYTEMMREADTLGIRTIPLRELLSRMGWKRPAHVVRFGPGSNPADFRAQPPEGVPRVSSGNVSPIFQPRKPPATLGVSY